MSLRSTVPALALALELAVALAATLPEIAQARPASAAELAPVPPGVESPEALVKSLYAVISGPAGQPRDWKRFRELCLPEARLISTRVLPDGSARLRSSSVDEYIESASKAFATEGFYESGAVEDVMRYDRTVTVVSPYESRRTPEAAPFARGVNHFQLFNDGRRWWVVDIFWENESPQAPLPPALARRLKR